MNGQVLHSVLMSRLTLTQMFSYFWGPADVGLPTSRARIETPASDFAVANMGTRKVKMRAKGTMTRMPGELLDSYIVQR